jgi:hypothetical protein
MNRTYYNSLIKKLAQRDPRNRRKGDEPTPPEGVERRQEVRRQPKEQLAVDLPVIEPRKVNIGAGGPFMPANIANLSAEKKLPGLYYAKVKNRATGKSIDIGKISVSEPIKIEREIQRYNEHSGANMPSLAENVLYHIQHETIALNTRMLMNFSLFSRNFLKAINAPAEELDSFSVKNDTSTAEANFVINLRSPVFASMRYKNQIIRLANKKIKK